jgi:hypothetical protein
MIVTTCGQSYGQKDTQHMSDDQASDKPVVYQVKVQGRLNEGWSDWFGGMTIALGSGSDGSPVTILTGAVADQPALRGILDKLWNLNMTLISVTRFEKDA